MDTNSYIARLESLLSGLPEAERQYAVAYFSEYLMDAGPEGAEAAMKALGPPETLAAQIKADVAMRDLGGGSQTSLAPRWGEGRSATAAGPSPAAGPAPAPGAAAPTPGAAAPPPSPGAPPNAPPPQGPPYASAPAQPGAGTGASAGTYPQPEPAKKEDSPLTVLLVVLLALFALPIGVPLAVAIIGLLVGLVAAVGGLIIGALATGLSLFVSGIFCIVAGFVALFSSWSVGVFYIGAGLILLAISLLFNLGMFYLLRLIIKGLAMLFNAIRKRVSKTPDITQQEVQNA